MLPPDEMLYRFLCLFCRYRVKFFRCFFDVGFVKFQTDFIRSGGIDVQIGFGRLDIRRILCCRFSLENFCGHNAGLSSHFEVIDTNRGEAAALNLFDLAAEDRNFLCVRFIQDILECLYYCVVRQIADAVHFFYQVGPRPDPHRRWC